MCDLCAFEALCISSPCEKKIQKEVTQQIDEKKDLAQEVEGKPPGTTFSEKANENYN